MRFTDGGQSARLRAERHLGTCDKPRRIGPMCEAHALATDVLTLFEMLQEAREAIASLADAHHRTLTGSDLHDPEMRDWTTCDCLTCKAAQVATS